MKARIRKGKLSKTFFSRGEQFFAQDEKSSKESAFGR